MSRVRELVDAAIAKGYLSLAAEYELQQLTQNSASIDDTLAMLILQQGLLSGRIQREGHEDGSSPPS